MKHSKEELIKSIMLLAKLFNEERAFEYTTKTCSLPSVVKDIIYLLFENNFSHESVCNDAQYVALSTIQSYVLELKENGFVNFED